jgi:hypothetical protein
MVLLLAAVLLAVCNAQLTITLLRVSDTQAEVVVDGTIPSITAPSASQGRLYLRNQMYQLEPPTGSQGRWIQDGGDDTGPYSWTGTPALNTDAGMSDALQVVRTGFNGLFIFRFNPDLTPGAPLSGTISNIRLPAGWEFATSGSGPVFWENSADIGTWMIEEFSSATE